MRKNVGNPDDPDDPVARAGGGRGAGGAELATQQRFRYSTTLPLLNKAYAIQQGLTRTLELPRVFKKITRPKAAQASEASSAPPAPRPPPARPRRARRFPRPAPPARPPAARFYFFESHDWRPDTQNSL